MLSSEIGEKTVFETKSTIEFIKANWKDSLGEQYVRWLEQSLERIKQMERSREIIRLKAEKIQLLCEDISSSDGDTPKVLKLTCK